MTTVNLKDLRYDINHSYFHIISPFKPCLRVSTVGVHSSRSFSSRDYRDAKSALYRPRLACINPQEVSTHMCVCVYYTCVCVCVRTYVHTQLLHCTFMCSAHLPRCAALMQRRKKVNKTRAATTTTNQTSSSSVALPVSVTRSRSRSICSWCR